MGLWTAPLHQEPTRAEIHAAVLQLREARLPDRMPRLGYGGGYFGPPLPAGVTIHEEYDGRWKLTASSGIFEAIQPQLNACLVEHRRDYGVNPIGIAVHEDGVVGRCEPQLSHKLPDLGTACICRAISTLRFGPGEKDRRARLAPMHNTSITQTKDGRRLRAFLLSPESDDRTATAALTGVDQPALEQCLVNGPVELPGKAQVTFQVSATGATESLKMNALAGADEATRACVLALLKRTRFACPQQGKATSVQAELTVF